MNGEYRLSERIDCGTECRSYLQRWVCDPPPDGVNYRVLREEWTDDYEIRTIYEIEISDAVDECRRNRTREPESIVTDVPRTMILTDTWIDKTEWGDGPWDDEPDRAEWVDAATGLRCLALRANPRFGYWCGYVAVPPGHPWHGSYPDIDPDVHGGITFAKTCMDNGRPLRERACHAPQQGEPDVVWWLGFDCGHDGDIAPAFAECEREAGEHYRTLGYVRAECARLAMQVHVAAGDSRRE